MKDLYNENKKVIYKNKNETENIKTKKAKIIPNLENNSADEFDVESKPGTSKIKFEQNIKKVEASGNKVKIKDMTIEEKRAYFRERRHGSKEDKPRWPSLT